jgi:endonuclease IV
MFGSHLSIAGSMANALREAESLGMDTVQVSLRTSNSGRSPLPADTIKE